MTSKQRQKKQGTEALAGAEQTDMEVEQLRIPAARLVRRRRAGGRENAVPQAEGLGEQVPEATDVPAQPTQQTKTAQARKPKAKEPTVPEVPVQALGICKPTIPTAVGPGGPHALRDPVALARNGLLFDLVSLYLERCADPVTTPENSASSGSPSTERTRKNAPTGRFPNLAGFCRFLGVGMARMEALSCEEPEIWDTLCAIFEDEALNSGVSASVLTPYFKKRLGYADHSPPPPTGGYEDGAIRLLFDHDIWEDGA